MICPKVRQRNDGSVPDEQDQVARRARDPRLVELDRRPHDLARLAVDQLDPRAGRLEVVELLGIDRREPPRPSALADERERRRGRVAASFQPLNAQISAGARRPSGSVLPLQWLHPVHRTSWADGS